jgi:SagB-type dehydrogenase family enzyme
MLTRQTQDRASQGASPDTVFLPPPRTRGNGSVAEALARRRSCREFTHQRLSLEQVGQLCWAAQGVNHPEGDGRTAPSAGALYPVAVYVLDADGVHRYEPENHALRRVLDEDVRIPLQMAALDQPWVGGAPLCLVLAIDVEKAAQRYGDRAERYCLLEAGHVAQNVLIQATALRLGGVSVGAFEDRHVSQRLRLPANLRPVYLLPLGHPAKAHHERAVGARPEDRYHRP